MELNKNTYCFYCHKRFREGVEERKKVIDCRIFQMIVYSVWPRGQNIYLLRHSTTYPVNFEDSKRGKYELSNDSEVARGARPDGGVCQEGRSFFSVKSTSCQKVWHVCIWDTAWQTPCASAEVDKIVGCVKIASSRAIGWTRRQILLHSPECSLSLYSWY